MRDDLIKSVRSALERQRTMVLCALPGVDSEYIFYESGHPRPLADETADFGFFYGPFDLDFSAPRLLPHAESASDIATIEPVHLPAHTSRDRYLRDVAMLAAGHAALKGGKTVYARRITDPDATIDWAMLADRYFSALPHTFRFLFATPSEGCWLGASPELLLRRPAGCDTVFTMALAGTLRDTTSSWDCKNREEHDYVTRFIVDTFRRFGLSPEVSPAEDIIFGPVRHLCHCITVHYSGPMLPLLRALSPTPALSGYPVEIARGNIRRLEGDRSLYGGYVGLNTPEGFTAYVNLRSLCFNPSGGYTIYSGGGITSLSVAADEWLETEAKCSLLRKCVGQSQIINPATSEILL